MYCSACGAPITAGLSFCNRCGISLKERSRDSKSPSPLPVVALVIAMVLVAVSGLGLLLGGPIALKREGGFETDLVVLFMLLTFLITSLTEIFLYRQLSRLTAEPKQTAATPFSLPTAPPVEYYAPQPQPRSLAEPLPSVTENTTRTLEYERNRRS